MPFIGRDGRTAFLPTSVNTSSSLKISNEGDLIVDTDTLFVDSSANRVGIGTASPSRALHINASPTDTAMLIESTDGDVQINFKDVDSTNGVSIGCDNEDFYVRSGLTTETLRITSDGKVRVPDNGKFTAGAGDDLQIYHDGSNSYIDDAGTGALFVRGSYLAFAGINGEQLINAEQNAAVELFHNNSRKFQTTTTGAKVTGNFEPEADATRDLGSASLRWANIYSADLQLSNEGAANDVDGTWGQYTIQEGEDDLFLINRRNGKKYKFMLQEVN